MKSAKYIYHFLRDKYSSLKQTQQIKFYKQSGYLPWSEGYKAFKYSYIQETINSPNLLEKFRLHHKLPQKFGWRLDERAVEYPWVFSRLSLKPTRFLDAGSAMNFEQFVRHLRNKKKEITIFNLAPEKQCFWHQKVSYQFGDLRNLPYKDGWFDEIVCISTLEHVGMDNRGYGTEIEEYSKGDYKVAILELIRVLRKDGQLLITLPFGKPQDIRRGNGIFMQQFSSEHLRQLENILVGCNINTQFFQYINDGWDVSSEEACSDAQYFNIHEEINFDPDFAAAARAVVCIEIVNADSKL